MSYPEKQVQTQYDYQTDDAKTVMVEKTLTQNPFLIPDTYNSLVRHNGVDPMTECTTYYPDVEYIRDRSRMMNNQDRLKEFGTPARIRPTATYQAHTAEANYREPLMLKSLQGFSTRAVTGPAIRSAETTAQGVVGTPQKRGGIRGALHL